MKPLITILLLGIALMMPSGVPAEETIYPAALNTTDTQIAGQALFDCRTGHKYLKVDEQTYMEFSRRGRFLKNVPATLPLLVNSPAIHPLSEANYILYKKSVEGETRFMLLGGESPHPKDWMAHKLLLTIN